MTDHEVKELLKVIHLAYPLLFKITQERYELWRDRLQDIAFKIAHARVMEHVNNEEYPPSIAKIRGTAAKKQTEDICETTMRPIELYSPGTKCIPADMVDYILKN